MNNSQLQLLVRATGIDDRELVHLTSSHLRPYASACLAVMYGASSPLPGGKISCTIRPGEERPTEFPDTQCLLSFLMDLRDADGNLVGTCSFKRVTLYDHVSDATSRILARCDAQPGTRAAAGTIQFTYCLHFIADGTPVAPYVFLPPVLTADIGELIRTSRPLQLSGDSSLKSSSMMTFMTENVYDSLEKIADESEAGNVEEGCLLDGFVLFDPQSCRFARLIAECMHVPMARKEKSSVQFNSDCWASYFRSRTGRGVLLAEGHTHPGILTDDFESLIFLSTSDKAVHRQFFFQFFQCTIIFSKHSGMLQAGIWGWENGLILPETEAFIVDDIPTSLLTQVHHG